MRYINKIFSILLFITFTLSAQDMDFFTPKTTIGGYGELHYNHVIPDAGKSSQKLDFHRFVLFFGHSFTEKWSFKSEVELEHNFVQGGHGELELEQAYVNYHHADYFGFQAGVVLPSAGLINEYHEPPLFTSVERPEYHSNLIPTTWFGNGAAVYGNIDGFDYKLVVMEGFNADKFSVSSGIRGGRQKGFNANARNLLYNARLDYLGIPGLKAGASVTYNKAMRDSLPDVPFTLAEFHAQYTGNNLYTVFEFGNISYSNYAVQTSRGWYFDLGYNIGSFFDWNSELIPFVRYSDINTAAETLAGGTSEQANHYTSVMVGISYKPIPQVVFKADYSQRKRELGDVKTKLFNLGAGYMF